MKSPYTLLLILLTSCLRSKNDHTSINASFKLPFIIQTNSDSVLAWDTGHMNEVYPPFIGQFRFTDRINLDSPFEDRRIDEKQFRWERRFYDFDTLSSDGLEIYPDYNKTIKLGWSPLTKLSNLYFPLYVVNKTNSPKMFTGKDSHVFAIQEARDVNLYGGWYAIELEGFDFCGHGRFRRKILPNEFVMILIPKYSGPDSTYLRTRIRIGASTIVSRPYKGNFCRGQFRLPQDRILEDDAFHDYKRAHIYGARIKEY
ncbi:MAG: hypothetical protein H7Y42_17420 [Chitinophagaceae bacterium]|nr:hypothetical protein [Chitinophagaceae bacterium]